MKGTRKILLRDLKNEDLDKYRFWNTGKKEWMKLDAPYFSRPSEEELNKMISRLKTKIESGDWGSPRFRQVIADKNSDEFLGTVSWYWESEATLWKSIGIAIYNPSHWGRGIGFEALKLWMDYLFEVSPKIVRLDLRTWSGNKGMMVLAEKLGFTQEACFRKARFVRGKYYDSIGYGILKEEWLEFRKQF